MSTLYVFLDESGNLDFSRGGTEHYVLAAVTSVIIPITEFDIFARGTKEWY